MTAGELAVLLAAVLCCIGFAALVVVLMRVLDALKALHGEVAELRAEMQGEPLLRELNVSTTEARAAVEEARHIERFDRVLGSAEAISGALTGGSRMALGGAQRTSHQDRRHRHGYQAGGAPSAPQGPCRPHRPQRAQGEERMIKRLTWFVGGAIAGIAGASVAKRKAKEVARGVHTCADGTQGRRSCPRSDG